jgi:hypothetical protein
LYNIDMTLLHSYPKGKADVSFNIPAIVETIESYAFYSCSNLTSVNIPIGVKNIKSSAFSLCSGLINVDIPNGVTDIGSSAFSYCSNIADLTIGNSVTSIGTYAFSGCSKIEEIIIPASVTSIGTTAFSNCSKIEDINIPASVTSIGTGAFNNCSSLTEITVDTGNNSFAGVNGVLYNKDGTFLHTYPKGKPGSSFNIPAGVTRIGEEAFDSCTSLTDVTIPGSVTNIVTYAFTGCTNMASFTCNAVTPPTLVNNLCGTTSTGGTIIPAIPTNLAIRVPSGSVAAYQSATNWSTFASKIQAQ